MLCFDSSRNLMETPSCIFRTCRHSAILPGLNACSLCLKSDALNFASLFYFFHFALTSTPQLSWAPCSEGLWGQGVFVASHSSSSLSPEASPWAGNVLFPCFPLPLPPSVSVPAHDAKSVWLAQWRITPSRQDQVIFVFYSQACHSAGHHLMCWTAHWIPVVEHCRRGMSFPTAFKVRASTQNLCSLVWTRETSQRGEPRVPGVFLILLELLLIPDQSPHEAKSAQGNKWGPGEVSGLCYKSALSEMFLPPLSLACLHVYLPWLHLLINFFGAVTSTSESVVYCPLGSK